MMVGKSRKDSKKLFSHENTNHLTTLKSLKKITWIKNIYKDPDLFFKHVYRKKTIIIELFSLIGTL
jgi:hypothetical protein